MLSLVERTGDRGPRLAGVPGGKRLMDAGDLGTRQSRAPPGCGRRASAERPQIEARSARCRLIRAGIAAWTGLTGSNKDWDVAAGEWKRVALILR